MCNERDFQTSGQRNNPRRVEMPLKSFAQSINYAFFFIYHTFIFNNLKKKFLSGWFWFIPKLISLPTFQFFLFGRVRKTIQNIENYHHFILCWGWSLSDRKFPQFFKIILSIRDDLEFFVIWITTIILLNDNLTESFIHIYQLLRSGRIWHKVNF